MKINLIIQDYFFAENRMSEFSVITQSYVSVIIQTDGKEYGVEKRYAKDVHVGELKNKLEMITGLVATDMKICLLNKEKKFVCNLEPDEKMLGYFPVEDGYILEVSGAKTVMSFDDESAVKKFELSEEEYAKRKNTMKEFKQKNKLGQFADDKQVDVLKDPILFQFFCKVLK